MTVVGATPLSHISALKRVTCDERDVVAVGQRVPGRRARRRAGCCARRRPQAVTGPARAAATAGPARGPPVAAAPRRRTPSSASRSSGTSTDRGRPVPGTRPPPAVRPAVGRERHDVVVLALDERRHPRPVDVPDQDPHGRTHQLAHGATTSSAVTDVRHGCPGTTQVLTRVSRHGACWSPSSTCGTPYGAQRAGGHGGREQRDDRRGDRGAEVRRAGVADDGRPQRRPARRRSVRRSVRPPRSTASSPATRGCQLAPRSAEPVTTTRQPSSRSARTASLQRFSRPGAGRHRGTRDAGRRRARHDESAAPRAAAGGPRAGRRRPQAAGSPAAAASESARSGSGRSSVDPVPHVEQRCRGSRR